MLNTSSPQFSSTFKVSLKIFLWVHIAVLIASFAYDMTKGFVVMPWRTEALDSDSGWHWIFYFTMQTNILVGFCIACECTKVRKLVKRFNFDSIALLTVSWISLTSLIYWAVLFPALLKRGMDGFEWFFSIWMHLVALLAYATVIIWRRKKISTDGYFSYWRPLSLSLIYPVIYFLIVVLLIQGVDPKHWSVYRGATLWFHYIDPAVQQQQEIPSATIYYMAAVPPALIALTLLWTWVMNIMHKKTARTPNELLINRSRRIGPPVRALFKRK